jgi:site-specific DNA-methyltransferase (adenine-specific)/modification methylase
MKLEFNKIICGDALEELKKIPNESVDLIITDPPYNVSTDLKIDRSRWGKKQKRKAIINFDYGEWDKMSEDDFEKFNIRWYTECKRVLKKGGSIYVFFTKELISFFHIHRFPDYEIKTKNIISWIKSNPLPAFNRTNYRSAVEFIYFGQKEGGKATFNFGQQKEMKNWFEYPLVQGKVRTKHPTQKPLELIQKFIEISSNKGDIVLDPFIGSGTTAVAAKMFDRNYIGIEKNPEYVKIANERINSIPQKLL